MHKHEKMKMIKINSLKKASYLLTKTGNKYNLDENYFTKNIEVYLEKGNDIELYEQEYEKAFIKAKDGDKRDLVKLINEIDVEIREELYERVDRWKRWLKK